VTRGTAAGGSSKAEGCYSHCSTSPSGKGTLGGQTEASGNHSYLPQWRFDLNRRCSKSPSCLARRHDSCMDSNDVPASTLACSDSNS